MRLYVESEHRKQQEIGLELVQDPNGVYVREMGENTYILRFNNDGTFTRWSGINKAFCVDCNDHILEKEAKD